ncbi:MAG: hypothetical protein NT027_04615 [Proteobacteria bacterium]|nr:hypothetical protein [Pseudomonadota bacterium]
MKFVSAYSKLFIFLSMCSSFVSMNSCKKNGSSSTKAIVSKDGKNAIGLLPMRHFYANTLKLTPGSAYQVQDALRLKYAAVHCKGDGAARVFNSLEDISRYTVLHLKHDKDQVMISQASVTDAMSGLAAANDKEGLDRFMDVKDKYFSIDSNGYYRIVKGTEKPCSILGDHALSGGSFVKLMADADTDFESKQILWLAARGRYTKNTSQAFSPAFYTFLRENIGAIPRAAIGQSIPRFQEIDKEFNPCAVESKNNGIFSCDNAGNYEIADEIFNEKLVRLLEIAKSANESYLKALQTAGASGKASSAGLQVAVTINSTISASGLVIEADGAPAAGNAPAPSSEEASKIHPAIATMFPKLATIQEYFDVNFELNQGQVLDMSNPVKILVDSASVTQERRLGLADEQVGFGLDGSVGTSTKPSSAPSKTSSTTNPSGASASAGSSTKPASMSMSQTIPPKAAPVQQTQIVPATGLNVGKVNDGGFWTRDEKNPNRFTHTDPKTGERRISQAVKQGDSWVYQNHSESKDGEKISGKDTIMFHKTDLVDGAGKNTFVQYKRKEGDAGTDGTINKDQYAKEDGKIYSQTSEDQKGGWLDFSRSSEEQRSRQLAGATKEDNAFIFKPENADSSFTPMLLKKETGKNKKADFSWIIPPASEQPEQMQSSNQSTSAQTASNKSTSTSKTKKKPASNSPEDFTTDKEHDGSSISGDMKMPVLTVEDLIPPSKLQKMKLKESADQESAQLKETKGSIGIMGTVGGAMTESAKKVLLFANEYQKKLDAVSEAAKSSKDPIEVQKLAKEADEAKLKLKIVERQEVDPANTNNSSAPKVQPINDSGATKDLVNELKIIQSKQEKLIEIREKQIKEGKIDEKPILSQQADILANELQQAKIQRQRFDDLNGPTYKLDGDNRVVRLNPQQIAQKKMLHEEVTRKEQAIAAIQRKLNALNGETEPSIPLPN